MSQTAQVGCTSDDRARALYNACGRIELQTERNCAKHRIPIYSSCGRPPVPTIWWAETGRGARSRGNAARRRPVQRAHPLEGGRIPGIKRPFRTQPILRDRRIGANSGAAFKRSGRPSGLESSKRRLLTETFIETQFLNAALKRCVC